MTDEEISRIASEEILNPSFAVTRQYLEVNKVPIVAGQPCVERIDRDEEAEGTITVYYPVQGEDYYISVYLDTHPQLSVRWVGTSPGIRVYLTVDSKVLELETLIKLFGLEPTKTWTKGQIKKNNLPHESNGFTYEPNPEKAVELEHKIEKLLNNLNVPKESLDILVEHAITEVTIAYYGYKAEMWGWHIERETIQRLAELNLSVDLDLYASGPNLLE